MVIVVQKKKWVIVPIALGHVSSPATTGNSALRASHRQEWISQVNWHPTVQAIEAEYMYRSQTSSFQYITFKASSASNTQVFVLYNDL
jgi:hypothetical protein